MSLSQIYINSVKNNPINNFTSSIGGMPQIERDPTISKLERDIANQLLNLIPKEEIVPINQPTVKSLSPEEALKELMSLSNS